MTEAAHRPWIVDGHLDLAWNALQWNRDLREPAHVLRLREAATSGPGRGSNTVSLPDLRRANVQIAVATVLARSTGAHRDHIDYASPHQATAIGLGHLAYYRALEKAGLATVISDLDGLAGHLDRLDDGATGPLGIVLAMEGADPILTPEDFTDWVSAGLRMLGLSHYGNGRYAGGTGSSHGLTALGRELLERMEAAGTILDLTHLTDLGIDEALALFRGPVVVSHGNARALVPNQRQFTDEHIREVAHRGGVIGAALDAWMLVPRWVKGAPSNPVATLRDAADHIEHVCNLLGNTDHAALGSDLDGGFGYEQAPRDLDTIADVQKLADLLRERGFTDQDLDRIFHDNWLRVLRSAWEVDPGA